MKYRVIFIPSATCSNSERHPTGRLSRSLWIKPAHYPTSFRSLRILIAETGPHHSWSADHLQSIHAVPFTTLSHLSVARREALPTLHNGNATYDIVVDDAVALKSVPQEFIVAIRGGQNLTDLQCDFWAWSVADLKALAGGCPNLKVLHHHIAQV